MGDNGRETFAPQTMSEEQLKAFMEAVKADVGLQEKLNAATDADAVVAISKAAGFVISAEAAEELQRSKAEVSEEDLEGVAGGYQFPLGDNEDSATSGIFCGCGEDNCDCMSCDTEATAD